MLRGMDGSSISICEICERLIAREMFNLCIAFMTGQGGTGTDNLFGFIQLGFDLFQARLPLLCNSSALMITGSMSCVSPNYVAVDRMGETLMSIKSRLDTSSPVGCRTDLH